MKSGCPTGVPKILTPCLSVATSDPCQTTARGFTILAASPKRRTPGLTHSCSRFASYRRVPFLCTWKNESSVCQTFLFVVSCSTGNVVEHRHEHDSSCEIQTSHSASRKDFAHMNKFSFLVPDTNSLMRGAFQYTRQGFTVNNAMMNEMMDALQTVRQVEKSPTMIQSIEAERSSSFVPCDVRLRQQGSSACEWVWLEEIELDYGLGIR